MHRRPARMLRSTLAIERFRRALLAAVDLRLLLWRERVGTDQAVTSWSSRDARAAGPAAVALPLQGRRVEVTAVMAATLDLLPAHCGLGAAGKDDATGTFMGGIVVALGLTTLPQPQHIAAFFAAPRAAVAAHEPAATGAKPELPLPRRLAPCIDPARIVGQADAVPRESDDFLGSLVRDGPRHALEAHRGAQAAARLTGVTPPCRRAGLQQGGDLANDRLAMQPFLPGLALLRPGHPSAGDRELVHRERVAVVDRLDVEHGTGPAFDDEHVGLGRGHLGCPH